MALQRDKEAYRAPVEELTGVRTFVSEKPGKGIQAPSGDSISHPPGESPKSDRSRVRPQRTDTKENLERDIPGNWGYNTPGPSGEGQKVHVRTPGTPGEDYGHPFKTNITPRRTDDNNSSPGDGSGAGVREANSVEVTRPPTYSKRQKRQMGEAKRYHQKYYLRHRGQIKTRAKKHYHKVRSNSLFKRVRKMRNNVDIGKKFNRLPAGGFRSNADRAKKQRDKTASVELPFWHPDFGSGVVLAVQEQNVVIQSEGLGLGEVPFFAFLNDVEFDSESDLDTFFEWADADFEDEVDPTRVAGTFYRETFTPGYNMDPGDGVRDLGAPSPYSPILKYPDSDHFDRIPSEEMDNIREVDNNPGSAKVIPSGHDFANKEASADRVVAAIRVAARMSEILNGLDPGVIDRAKVKVPKLIRSDPGNLMFRFQVPGSKGEKYIVRVKGTLSAKGIRSLSKMDLELSCSCNFSRWQGPEHHSKVEEYLYGKPVGTASVPVVRDPEGVKRTCKHVVAVMDVISKWAPIPASK